MRSRRAVPALAGIALTFAGPAPAADPPTPAAVFEQRLVPIFKSPDPSSCVRCHLAAVDLKDYILPSSADTFLALRDQGLIDLDKPAESKILKLIARGAGGNPVAAKLQREEYEAFAAWIVACAADPVLRAAAKPESPPALPVKPAAVVRYARADRLLESFESTVWALRFRCMNCHTEGTPQNDKLRAEHGDRVGWFKRAGPAATMDYLLASKLIDLADPGKSLLLTKPLGTVKHGGGVKFAPGDQGETAVRAWVEDVAAVKGGKYATAADLPARDAGPKRFGTDLWLKLTDTPAAWGDKLLRADVYAWDAKANDWEAGPVATSDRVVWGKGRLWQHCLTLLAAPGSDRAKTWARDEPTLVAGKYLVKVYLVGPGKEEFAGRVEIRSGWPAGYGAMTAADAGRVRP